MLSFKGQCEKCRTTVCQGGHQSHVSVNTVYLWGRKASEDDSRLSFVWKPVATHRVSSCLSLEL